MSSAVIHYHTRIFSMKNMWFLLACFLYITQYGRLYPPALESIRPFALMSFGLAGLLFLSGKEFFQWKYPSMQAIWIMIGWMLLATPFAMNYGHVFMNARSVIMFLPFMLTIILLINDTRQLKFLVNVIIFVAILNTARGYMMFDGAGRNTMFNLGAFLTDPNDFSLYMNMCIPFTYFMFLQEMKWSFKKLVYGLATVAMVAMVIASFSRGGMVGLACAAIVMWWFSPNRAVTATLGVVGLMAVLVFSGDTWLNAMSSTTNLEHSTIQARFVTWIAALEIFVDNPIMGVGAGNFPFHLENYIPPNHRYTFQVAHSVWFTVLAEGGIVGVFLYGWLLFSNWIAARRLTMLRQIDTDARYLKHYGAACLASMVAYMASGSFLTTNYYPHIWYLTAFIVVGAKLHSIHFMRYSHAYRPIHQQY